MGPQPSCQGCVRALTPRSRTGGVAQNEIRINYHLMICHRSLAGLGNQRCRDQMPDCISWYVHCGERGVAELRELHIIEPGDRDILRNADAAQIRIASWT